jgi:hypothetical protein
MLSHIQDFTADDTWTAPAGIDYVQVVLIGGGGTGGDANGLTYGGFGGSGGGGGGYVQAIVKVVPGTAYAVTVGGVWNGGNPPCGIEWGRPGGASVFNGVTAGGGGGGGPAHVYPHYPGPGGAPGLMSGGPASFFGSPGTEGTLLSGGEGGVSGSPTPTVYGHGGHGSNNCGAPVQYVATPGFVRIAW